MDQVPPQLRKILEEANITDRELRDPAIADVRQRYWHIRPSNKQQLAEANDARAGDHLTLLNVYEAYKEQLNTNGSNGKAVADWCWNNYLDHRSLKSADSVQKQQVRIMERLRLPMLSPGYNSKDYYVNIRKCILSGFYTQVAFLDRSGHYTTVRDEQAAALHPDAVWDTDRREKELLARQVDCSDPIRVQGAQPLSEFEGDQTTESVGDGTHLPPGRDSRSSRVEVKHEIRSGDVVQGLESRSGSNWNKEDGGG